MSTAAKKKRPTPADEATSPALTANWYDATEMACALRTCLRRGHQVDAVRVAVERDRSGDGAGVFASLATACVEDVGLASPMALSAVLASMAMWEASVAAGKHREARAHLAAVVAATASWPKSRLVADASIKTIEVDLEPLVASMTTETAFDEMGGHALLTDSVAWAASIAEPVPSARKAAAAAAIEACGRIDAQRAVATFAGLARVASEVWANGVTPADIEEAQKDDTGTDMDEAQQGQGPLEREGGAAAQPPAEGEAVDMQDAAALAEGTTLMVEEGVLALGHIVLAIECIECRRVEWPPKGAAAPHRPSFVDDAMRLINAEPGADAAHPYWPTLAGRAAREFFCRPVAWAFGPLLAVARGANCERAVMALLSLMEALARGLVHARPALTAAVLLTARHAVISWDERKIQVQALATRPDIAEAIEAYDAPCVSDLVARGALDAASIATARVMVVDPERHLDGTTARHAGRSTLDTLAAAVAGIAATDPLAGALWTSDEMAKSHGPAFCSAPSDACLAAGVALPADAAAAPHVDNVYAAVDSADAAARVRSWTDSGDTAARIRHPVWVHALGDVAYVVPTPPKRPSSSSRKRPTGPQQQQQQQQKPRPSQPSPSRPKAASPKRRREPPTSTVAASSDSNAPDGAAADAAPPDAAPAAKRHKPDVAATQNAVLATIVPTGATEPVRASDAASLLRPGCILRIVEVIYEEVDPSDAMDIGGDATVRMRRNTASHAAGAHSSGIADNAATSTAASLPRPVADVSAADVSAPIAQQQHTPAPSTEAVSAPAQRPSPSLMGGTAAPRAPTRSRSRAADALAPCPDLVARLAPRVLDDAAIARIETAPLAQKPTLTTKKCVYMLADGAYKGPYAVDQRADVVRVVRTLYRERVMRDLWGDAIVARHEPVFDPHARVIYLRMDLVGDRGPEGDQPWSTLPFTVKRGGSEYDVEVVNRDSHGLVIINTMEWLGSENFVGAFAHVVVHMAARYLIDGGDANLNNIIGCPRRGAPSVTAVDIEDNRNCSKKKKKKTKKAAATVVVVVADGEPTDGDAADGEPRATPAAPTLMRCLFAPGRGPKADEQPTFDALLREHMGVVRDFVDRVRTSFGTAAPGEIVPGAAEYAHQIGYVEATAGAEVPTCGQIAARLAILEACLDEFEGIDDNDDEDDGGGGALPPPLSL
ncbi:hypothetical protein psal_cds_227 [Pandoravirus salinus]|uniref:Uncharacterized protein n=1 Tax=Pandoravirus salinus TaxID=1349410 RepID=S4W0W6_9VIRU|nr:PRK00708 superfamily incomplete domain [Pandoravirus salinus]AGO83765.1 hypothetical protein psal_cds_227 [Pandoravirus salinus]